jgi:hypothetical protein
MLLKISRQNFTTQGLQRFNTGKDTVCGLVLSLSLTVTGPPVSGAAFGSQETLIVQDCPGPTLVPQVLLCEKAVPPTLMLSMARLVLRLLVRVVVSGGLHEQLPVRSRSHTKVRLLGTSLTGPVPCGAQVSIAVPCSEPGIPAAEAVMVTGPPTPTQVAAPVLELIVAVVVSEDAHCADILVWVVGGWAKVPVALNGTVSP